jgi:hypothetical protein
MLIIASADGQKNACAMPENALINARSSMLLARLNIAMDARAMLTPDKSIAPLLNLSSSNPTMNGKNA